MDERKTIIHDITMLLLNERCTDKTPENLLKVYYEISSEVKSAYDSYNKTHKTKGKVLSRSEFGL